MGTLAWAQVAPGTPVSSPAAPRAGAARPSDRTLSKDAALAKAVELQNKGENRAAAEAYRSWLDSHARPADPAVAELYVEALLRFAEVETDARLVQHLLSMAPMSSFPAASRWRVTAALAELLDSLGDVSAAQSLHEESARTDPAPSGPGARRSLLRSASLLYEEGEWDRSEAQAREVAESSRKASDEERETGARYLLGRIHAASGRNVEALSEWRSIIDAHPASPSAPGACLGLWMLYAHLEMKEEARAMLELLELKYPSSPEREIARSVTRGPVGAQVTARPWALLESYADALFVSSPEPDQASAAPQAPPAASQAQPSIVASSAVPSAPPSATGAVLVLAGSYLSRENAERHASEVQAAGFASRIVDTVVSGKHYFRVLVGDPTSYDSAMALMRKMKDRNLESVPILATEGQ